MHMPETATRATPEPAGGGIVVDPAREADAPAIARCFLEVYGHHDVNSHVFSPRRYWARIAAGERIPAVTRNARAR